MYKVLIRPLEIADAEISWRWRNNPKIWELTGSRPPTEITFEIESNWIEKVVSDKTSKRFAILVDDIYVGNIQLTNIIKNEFAEYHIFIGDTSYWNKGIARLASLQIIRYAKNVLQLKKLVLQVNPDHSKAIKLYQSINFIITSGEIKMELELEKSPKPLVSIFVMVYNHEKYLNQAIDGILMQKSNFDFEIVVGEDYSTDNSREILIQYQNKYPGKFNLLLHDKNIGPQKNQIEVLNNCKGKYIAICEGDDYWTDPNKLQKQVDFLEANEDYVIHSGNARILSNDSSNASMVLKTTSDSVFEIDHFYKNNNIITCTVLFRNQTIDFPDFFNKIIFGDWFLYVILMFKTKQKVYLSSELFSVYRVHSGGVMSNLSKEKNLLAHVFQIKSIQKYIGNRFYSKDIERKLNYYYLEIFLLRCYDENYKNALLILFENLKSCFKTFPIKSYFGFLKLFIFKKINQSKK